MSSPGCKDRCASATPKKDADANRTQVIGVECDDQFIARVNQRKLRFLGPSVVRRSPEKFGAKIVPQNWSLKKGFFASLRRGRLFASWPIGSLVVFFTDFGHVRPVSAFFGEPASLPDPRPDDATWRACAPKLRRCPASGQPQSRSRGRASRASRSKPVPPCGAIFARPAAQRGYTRDTYIYIYRDFAKPKRPRKGR